MTENERKHIDTLSTLARFAANSVMLPEHLRASKEFIDLRNAEEVAYQAVASERAEPTAEVEKELRQFALDKGRCYGKNKQGVRCRKRLVPPNAYCSGDCDFSAEPTANAYDRVCHKCCEHYVTYDKGSVCCAKCTNEPTATEPEVPDEERCTLKHSDGRRCLNRVVKLYGKGTCKGLTASSCNFGDAPDVPSEGEHRHCNTCGMRSHGTNAELRSQVDELRAKLKTAEIDKWKAFTSNDELRYSLDQATKKAGDA